MVQAALTDISSEVKSNDWDLKAGAVLKLTYVRRSESKFRPSTARGLI